MLYQGINLMNIIRDGNTFELWSASERAYELFEDTLDQNKVTVEIPNLPWCKVVYSELAPSELFLEITTNWGTSDWIKAKSMKSKITVASRNSGVVATLDETSVEAQLEETRRLQTTFLKALDSADGMLTKALRISKTPRKTYNSWMQTDRLFNEAVTEIAELVKDTIEGKLISEAQEGDMHAIKYFMDARATDRGYGKVDERVVEQQQELDLDRLSIEEQRQLSALIEKATPIMIE